MGSLARQLKLPVPVTIVTGALASGKSTALGHLLRSKPPGEVWAVLVNEFGTIDLDAITLSSAAAQAGAGAEVEIKQIAGGCMCCVSSGLLSTSIAQIVRRVKPDRLLVEPSGLGHPGGLVDVLQGEHLRTALQINAILCLVDLSSFNAERLMSEPVFADQVNIADVLIGSKEDLVPQEVVAGFTGFALELFPPKAQVLTVAEGAVDRALLDLPRSAAMRTLFQPARNRSSSATSRPRPVAAGPVSVPDSSTPAAGAGEEQSNQPPVMQPSAEPSPGHPVCVSGPAGDGYISCGFTFAQQDIFDGDRLLRLLQELQAHTARVKGVFRVGSKTWVTAVTARGQHSRASSSSELVKGALALKAEQQAGEHVRDTELPAVGVLPQLELVTVCYRGPSLLQVIVKQVLGCAEGVEGLLAADPGLEPAAAKVGLQPGVNAEPTVEQAITAAAQGNWALIEHVLQQLAIEV